MISATGLATTTGTISTAVKGAGLAKATLGAPVVEPLPSGDWSAVLNGTPDLAGVVLSRTIDLMLPRGTVQIPLAGKYNAKKDSESIKARGDKANPDAGGLFLALKNATSAGAGDLAADAKAKVQGLELGGPVATD